MRQRGEFACKHVVMQVLTGLSKHMQVKMRQSGCFSIPLNEKDFRHLGKKRCWERNTNVSCLGPTLWWMPCAPPHLLPIFQCFWTLCSSETSAHVQLSKKAAGISFASNSSLKTPLFPQTRAVCGFSLFPFKIDGCLVIMKPVHLAQGGWDRVTGWVSLQQSGNLMTSSKQGYIFPRYSLTGTWMIHLLGTQSRAPTCSPTSASKGFFGQGK